MQFNKEFNSSGPNIPERHYTLHRTALMTRGRQLVYDDRFFTLFAPRQSGKSTFFTMLGEQLKTEGYKVCYTNWGHNRHISLSSFLISLGSKMQAHWGIAIDATDFDSIIRSIEACNTEKLVLAVDEVEGINADFLNDFLVFAGFNTANNSTKIAIINVYSPVLTHLFA